MPAASLYIAYPAGSEFNVDYYKNKHLPPAIAGWSKAAGFVGYKLQTPVGQGSPYDAVLQVTFESLEALGKSQAAITPEQMQALKDDVPNFSKNPAAHWVMEVQDGA
ncbi:hypothetical protein JX265_006492 [Neoarthrinium moseri]|uniref:EthD domain-containing protein n=1 Tax=Neoarthrinium moseri TaxID=1658444 RepID=A0A9Q0ALP1_9PEZI|nr:uncharacterized protein JN550_003136 [Neoarthrinium moseri]KAI1855365.1 hypothetical protein JX266_000230 [Neoarthrinium moseri]KAI1869402.1 hypothetical protein JX265_006492 [Neoarthrinium moseri]KAI1873867.1 hypothetical protein JN550_003136 [Neoarthrinium moseri]